MKHFSVFQALIRFYDPAVYRDVARHWKGLGLIFCLIAGLYTAIYPTISVNSLIEKNSSTLNTLPKFSYDHNTGLLSSEPTKAKLDIIALNGQKIHLLIDTTREFSDKERLSETIIIGRKYLSFPLMGEEMYPFNEIFSQLTWKEQNHSDSTFSAEDLGPLKSTILYMTYASMLIASTLQAIINTAMIALVLTIFSRFMRIPTFSGWKGFCLLMRLTALCGCPAYFIDAFIRHVFTPSFLLSLIPMFIHVFFLMKAFSSLERPKA